MSGNTELEICRKFFKKRFTETEPLPCYLLSVTNSSSNSAELKFSIDYDLLETTIQRGVSKCIFM